VAKRKRRRRVKTPDNPTPDLTLRCEARDCEQPLPFGVMGVELPGMPRRVILCPTHWRLWFLDSLRALTRAWRLEQEAMAAAQIEEWALNHVSLVARLETELAPMPLEWRKPIVLDVGGAKLATEIPIFGPRAQTLDWGSERRIAEVVLS